MQTKKKMKELNMLTYVVVSAGSNFAFSTYLVSMIDCTYSKKFREGRKYSKNSANT
jgi:hypothetical protein